MAERLGIQQSQVALAWVLSKSEVASPIVGGTKLEYLDDAIAALDVTLCNETIIELKQHYQCRAVAI